MKYYILSFVAALALVSCNDDFLEVYPRDTQTVETAFVTSANFETYAWGLYDIFSGYSDAGLDDDKNGGNLVGNASGGESDWAMARYTVPSSGGGWDFSYIRECNLMLDRIDLSSMSDEEKQHWRAVGLFFRSNRYFTLLHRFGDVPWIEHVLETDSEELYYPRTSRDTVAANILRDLKEAAATIREDGNGDNTVNTDVVNTLLSRFALMEGTWRRYHLGDEEGAKTYLREAADAALAVINSGRHTVNDNADEIFNSEDLTGVESVILFRQYTAGESVHAYTRRVRTGEATFEGTKSLVDWFLCSDGKPISTSDLYADHRDSISFMNHDEHGKYTEYRKFRNRDRRLYLTICPPYNTATTGSTVTEPVLSDLPRDNEWIEFMNSSENSSWTGTKRLPHTNFREYVCHQQPNLKTSTSGRYTAWGSTQMGYFMWKYYNLTTDVSSNPSCTSDAPIYRYEEILLNYAEAMCELGEFTQDVADMTVNLLRRRSSSNVSDLNVAEVSSAGYSWDPAFEEGGFYARTENYHDAGNSALLWEIRRERRLEFVGEGFSFRDIRRWAIADLMLNSRPMGAWIDREQYGGSTSLILQDENGNTLDSSERFGYGAFYSTPTGWLEHYYLYPLPLDQLVLNPNLVQNPGW